MNHFKLTLPVKPYIRKYLAVLYGDPIIINLNTDIGFAVLNALASRMEFKISKGNIDLFQNRFTDEIELRIPIHYFSLTKKDVSSNTIVLLNRYLEYKFDLELKVHLATSKVPYGTTVKKGIELFLSIYNIEMDVDITYEAITKANWRHNKNLSDKFSRNLSEAKTKAVA